MIGTTFGRELMVVDAMNSSGFWIIEVITTQKVLFCSL